MLAAAKRKWAVEPLTRDEVDSLIGACSKRAPSGLRDRALIATMFGAGLRIAEALALLPRDYSEKEKSLNVRRGKGSRQRTVAYLPTYEMHLERWLELRKELGIGRSKPVFCLIQHDRVGETVTQDQVRGMLARRKKKAGIEKRVHAHGLRHSYASFLQRRARLDLVQHQLGHASIATTAAYVHQIDPHKFIGEVRQIDMGD